MANVIASRATLAPGAHLPWTGSPTMPGSAGEQSPTNEGGLLRQEERPPRNDGGNVFDIAIIGAGAVGSAIARELSHYELSIILLEAGSDVGMGTSKASTAIWHTAFDAKPGSLEATLLRRSYPLMETFTVFGKG